MGWPLSSSPLTLLPFLPRLFFFFFSASFFVAVTALVQYVSYLFCNHLRVELMMQYIYRYIFKKPQYSLSWFTTRVCVFPSVFVNCQCVYTSISIQKSIILSKDWMARLSVCVGSVVFSKIVSFFIIILDCWMVLSFFLGCMLVAVKMWENHLIGRQLFLHNVEEVFFLIGSVNHLCVFVFFS